MARRAALVAPGGAYCKCADGHAAGHLDDGEEGVDTFEGLGFYRHSQDGEGRHGGAHAGEVGGSPCPRDDNLDAAGVGGLGVFVEEVRGAVGGHYLDLEEDA